MSLTNCNRTDILSTRLRPLVLDTTLVMTPRELQEVLDRLRWTKGDLAAYLHKSERTIERYLTGEVTIPQQAVMLVNHLLGEEEMPSNGKDGRGQATPLESIKSYTDPTWYYPFVEDEKRKSLEALLTSYVKPENFIDAIALYNAKWEVRATDLAHKTPQVPEFYEILGDKVSRYLSTFREEPTDEQEEVSLAEEMLGVAKNIRIRLNGIVADAVVKHLVGVIPVDEGERLFLVLLSYDGAHPDQINEWRFHRAMSSVVFKVRAHFEIGAEGEFKDSAKQ